MLKKLRVLFAVVMGAVITFYFLDFAGLTTGWPNLARIQFVPERSLKSVRWTSIA